MTDFASLGITDSWSTPRIPEDSTTISGFTISEHSTYVICQNGGTYDGIKCICTDMFYGPHCETIIDRIEPVKSVETSVKVELKITNKPFDDNYKNNQSEEYKEFETEFKDEMRQVYKDLEGYKDIEIVEIRSGSIIVDHRVIVEIQYKEDVNVTDQYEVILEQIKDTVDTVKTDNCTDSGILCYDPDFGTVSKEEIPNIDFCIKKIPPEFQEFYTQIITSEGLTCISHCDPSSRYYHDCNGGRCVIQKGADLQCYCPRTDLYIYSGSECTGRILKSGVYGAVGAAIGILAIIIATVAFLLFKAKKDKTSWDVYSKDNNEKWFEDYEEDQWSQEHGFTNVNLQGDSNEEGSSSMSSQSNKEKFTPRLETVDTTLQIKIQRPEVSFV